MFHYTWAVRTVVGLVERWREQRTKEPTEYIFDRMVNSGKDRAKKREIELLFEYSENQSDALHRYGIYRGCHSFRDRCEVTPLQASDLLAWSVYQRGLNELTGKLPEDIAIEIYDQFVGSKRVYAGICTRQQLQKFVSESVANPELFREPLIFPMEFPYAKARS